MRFSVGAKLHIRSWDDMKEEYEINMYGNICFPDGIEFVTEMRFLCGATFTVKDTYEAHGTVCYLSEEGIEYLYEDGNRDDLVWEICDYMFEEYCSCNDISISQADLLEVLSSG